MGLYIDLSFHAVLTNKSSTHKRLTESRGTVRPNPRQLWFTTSLLPSLWYPYVFYPSSFVTAFWLRQNMAIWTTPSFHQDRTCELEGLECWANRSLAWECLCSASAGKEKSSSASTMPWRRQPVSSLLTEQWKHHHSTSREERCLERTTPGRN